MDLFYFPRRGGAQALAKGREMLEAFVGLSGHPALACMDSPRDAQLFREALGPRGDIRVTHSLEGAEELARDGAAAAAVRRWLDPVPWNAYAAVEPLGAALADVVLAKALVFERLLRGGGVRFVHFGDSMAFRCLGALVLERCAAHHGTPFFMAYSTALKGRDMVYDNLLHVPGREFVRHYAEARAQGLPPGRRAEVERYVARYRAFQDGAQKEHFRSKAGRSRAGVSLRQLLRDCRAGLARAGLRRRYGRAVNAPVSGPYFLLVLNKSHNWLTNYALPFWEDVEHLARSAWMALPPGHSLVVKDHPLTAFPDPGRAGLYRMARDLPGFAYHSGGGDTWALVDGAAGVLFNCSSAGVEALVRGKHVVAFGGGAVFFDFPDAPVHKVLGPGELPGALRACVEREPDAAGIMAYLDAMLHWSGSALGPGARDEVGLAHGDGYPARLGAYIHSILQAKGIVS
jgi:hypothetical protein